MIIVLLTWLFCSSAFAAELPVVLVNPEQTFDLKAHLSAILQPYMILSDDCAQIYICGDKTYHLTQQMAQKLVGAEGTDDKNIVPGRHTVTAFNGVHFKVNGRPWLKPGREFALFTLLELLLEMRDVLAPTHLIILKNVNTKNEGKKNYVIQASRSMGNQSLKQFIDFIDEKLGSAAFADPEKKKRLDDEISRHYATVNMESFSAHITRSILTNPGDDKDDNIRTHLSNGRISFIGIDNDEDDAVPVYLDRKLHAVGVRSLLYLMKQLMDKPFDSIIARRIVSKDPKKLLAQWLDLLETKNHEYEQLVAEGHLSRQELEELSLPLKLREGEVATILHVLKEIQSCIQAHMTAGQVTLTHQELLNKVQPLVGRFYAQIAKGASSLTEGYRIVLNDATTPANLKQNLEGVLDLREVLNGQPTYVALRQEKKSASAHEEAPRITIAQAREEQKKASKGTPLISQVENLSDESEILAAIENFLQGGGNLHSTDGRGNSALDVALKKHYKRVICNLVNRGAVHAFKEGRATECYEYFEANLQMDSELKAAFDKLEKNNTQFGFCRLVKRALSNQPVHGGRWCMMTSSGKPFYLTADQCNQLWDNNGKFKRLLNSYGRKDSNHLTIGTQKLWFKYLPLLSGYDYCISTLNRRAIGAGSTFVDLAAISKHPYDTTTKVIDYTKNEPYRISLGIEGENLEEEFAKQERINAQQNPPCLLNLDPDSTFKSIIMAFITNIEDGKGDNYIIEKLPNGSYHLVCIDGESAFLPTLALKNGVLERQAKCILFCLNEMVMPIPEAVKKHFASINAYKLFREWLEDASAFQRMCFHETLFADKKVRDALWNEKDEKKKSFIGIPLGPGMISRLYEKFVQVQQALVKPEVVTPFDLLHELESPLESEYGVAFGGPMTVYQRFKLVDNDLFNKVKRFDGREVSASKASIKEVLMTQSIAPVDSIPDIIDKGEYIGPDAAIKELDSISKHLEKHVKGDIKEFDQCKTNPDREEFLKKTDFAKLDEAKQNALFAKLKPFPWRDLRIRNSRYLTNTTFENLALADLQRLNVSGCQGLSLTLVNLLSKCPYLTSLNLSGNTELTKLARERAILADLPLPFPALVKLVLNRCARLTSIQIQAPLISLVAQKCTSLTSLTLANQTRVGNQTRNNLQTLRVVDLQGNIGLTNQEFERFVADCPTLQTAYLQGTKITYPELREFCPTYPAQLYSSASPELQERILLILKKDAAITSLHLGTNACNDLQFQALCYALRDNNVVKELHLDKNDITDAGISHLRDLLKINTTIRRLDLGDNLATNQGLTVLESILKTRPNLTQLNVCTTKHDMLMKELDLAQSHPMLETFPLNIKNTLLQKISQAKQV